MTTQLDAIRGSVMDLINSIEAAVDAPDDDPGDRVTIAAIARHPVIYAIGLFCIGLASSHLLARARRRQRDRDRGRTVAERDSVMFH